MAEAQAFFLAVSGSPHPGNAGIISWAGIHGAKIITHPFTRPL